MTRVLGLLGLVIVLGIGAYIYKQQILATSVPGGAKANPVATVDVAGVKNDLVAIANAERRRYASDGKYVPISDLISNGDISMQSPTRGPYSYTSDVSDTGFKITATYSGAEPGVVKTWSIDQTMEVKAE